MPIRIESHQRAARRISRNVLAMNVALVLTSLLALYAVWHIGILSRAAMNTHATDRMYVQELRLTLQRAAALDRAFLLTGDPSIAVEYADAEGAFYQQASELNARIVTPRGQQLLSAAIDAKKEHTQAAIQAIEHRMLNRNMAELREMFEQELSPRTQAAETALRELLSYKSSVLDEASDAAARAAYVAQIALLVFVLVNLILSVAMRWLTKRTLRTLNTYSEQLIRAIQGRDEFLAVASHELRTPLSVIKLQTQMLRRRLQTDDPAATQPDTINRFTAQVEHNVDTLTRLISRMLDLANISRGQLHLSRSQVNLNELTQGVIERMTAVFAQAGCEVNYQNGQPAIGCWDETRLEQVVSNLLVNIVRHAPGQPACVSVTAEDGLARLTVEDQGPGVSEIDRTRIFERFERAKMATDGTGMGLGLAVSQEIIRAHGGRIWVESAAGQGAKFVLELPLQTEGETCPEKS